MYIINHILSTAEFSSSGSVVGGERRNKNKMKIRWQWQNNKKKWKKAGASKKKFNAEMMGKSGVDDSRARNCSVYREDDGEGGWMKNKL